MSQPKIKYQQIIINIPAAGFEAPIDSETDKLYKKVTGVNVVITDANGRFSTMELEINNLEVFPENFEVLRLLFREQVPFGYEYHELNEPASGSTIKGKYRDVPNGAVYPYKAIISLRLEND